MCRKVVLGCFGFRIQGLRFGSLRFGIKVEVQTLGVGWGVLCAPPYFATHHRVRCASLDLCSFTGSLSLPLISISRS